MQQNDFHTVRGYQLLAQGDKQLTSAMEDYLEMIYRNIRKDGYMRINTLAEMLNVKPSSATKMVQKLTGLALLDYKKYGIIFLTERGKEIGEFLLNRHNIIEKFLKCIGTTDDILTETELIEHNIGSNTLKNIDLLTRFLDIHPEVITELEQFKRECSSAGDPSLGE
ncbi:MAG: DtxR family transcriptional regulator [Clostridiaceae bacterium]|nr:DtxR family transcriptional regulator [Clostridiaceae bacterium]